MTTFTWVHVVISLIGIVTGLVVLAGLLTRRPLPVWTGIFLTTTLATSVTGFGFPFERLLPSHVLAIISIVALAVAIFALYARRLQGFWRPVYVVTALFSLYINLLVLIVQSFLKVPALHALAPTQTEAPFVVSQLLLLFASLALGALALLRFRQAASAGGKT